MGDRPARLAFRCTYFESVEQPGECCRGWLASRPGGGINGDWHHCRGGIGIDARPPRRARRIGVYLTRLERFEWKRQCVDYDLDHFRRDDGKSRNNVNFLADHDVDGIELHRDHFVLVTAAIVRHDYGPVGFNINDGSFNNNHESARAHYDESFGYNYDHQAASYDNDNQPPAHYDDDEAASYDNDNETPHYHDDHLHFDYLLVTATQGFIAWSINNGECQQLLDRYGEIQHLFFGII